MNIDLTRIIDKFFGQILALYLIGYDFLKKFIFGKNRSSSPIKKILIIRFFGFGNLVLAFPSIKKISEIFPDAKIYLLTINKNMHLYDGVTFIDKTLYLNVNSFENFAVSFFKMFFCLRKEKFDLAVDFEIFAYISVFLLYFLGIKKRVGYRINGYLRGSLYTTAITYNNEQHISKTFYDLVVPLGAEKKENIELIGLSVSMKDKAVVEEFLKKNFIDSNERLVGMHVGSGQNFINRRWPETYFAKVADFLIKEFNAKIILTGTKEELPLINNTINEIKSDKNKVVIAENFNLSQLAFLIRHFRVFFCSDTGPLHLAVAMSVPTVSFFGPNTPLLYGPPNNSKHIFFYEKAYCSPCITNYNAKMSNCKKPICLTSISAEKVIVSIGRFLEKFLKEFKVS